MHLSLSRQSLSSRVPPGPNETVKEKDLIIHQSPKATWYSFCHATNNEHYIKNKKSQWKITFVSNFSGTQAVLFHVSWNNWMSMGHITHSTEMAKHLWKENTAFLNVEVKYSKWAGKIWEWVCSKCGRDSTTIQNLLCTFKYLQHGNFSPCWPTNYME